MSREDISYCLFQQLGSLVGERMEGLLWSRGVVEGFGREVGRDAYWGGGVPRPLSRAEDGAFRIFIIIIIFNHHSVIQSSYSIIIFIIIIHINGVQPISKASLNFCSVLHNLVMQVCERCVLNTSNDPHVWQRGRRIGGWMNSRPPSVQENGRRHHLFFCY